MYMGMMGYDRYSAVDRAYPVAARGACTVAAGAAATAATVATAAGAATGYGGYGGYGGWAATAAVLAQHTRPL